MLKIKVTIIRLLTALVPVKRARKRLRSRWLAVVRTHYLQRMQPRIFKRYAAHEAACRAKLARGEKLRVAFVVCDASMFSAEPVFKLMLDDPRYEPFIAVVPRVTRGDDFLRKTIDKTLTTLCTRYGEKVRSMYEVTTHRASPLEADIVFSSLAYEDQSCAEFTTETLSRSALVAFVYYGYGGLFSNNEKRTPFLPNIVFAWRYFVTNEATRCMNVTVNPMLQANIRVVGYAKMDSLQKSVEHEGCRIIIAPHHSLERETDGLKLSTFLFNYQLWLELPKLFPQVQFIFRPHPLLFARLRTKRWWGEAKTREYEQAMEQLPNVEFQRGGDYFATFASSDALIHDCGSFLAEYFYTGKRQCYLIESDATIEQFQPFAKQLFAHCTTAYKREDVIEFVRQIVDGVDNDKQARDEFARKEVCVNHSCAARAIIEELSL